MSLYLWVSTPRRPCPHGVVFSHFSEVLQAWTPGILDALGRNLDLHHQQSILEHHLDFRLELDLGFGPELLALMHPLVWPNG